MTLPLVKKATTPEGMVASLFSRDWDRVENKVEDLKARTAKKAQVDSGANEHPGMGSLLAGWNGNSVRPAAPTSCLLSRKWYTN